MAESLYHKKHTDIKFRGSHVGGNNNASREVFEDNLELIEDEKERRTKTFDINTEPQNNKIYRINDYPTVVENNNITNPIIIPKKYDPLFEYYSKTNKNGINVRVIENYNYINIDSTLQNNPSNVTYYQLPSNSLTASNNSSTIKVKIDDLTSKFNIGEKITLQGLSPITKNLQNVNFIFENGSNIVTIDLDLDFQYITNFYNVLIKFEKIENGTESSFKNIPLSALNQIQNILLINNNISFKLPLTFHTNDISILVSSCSISFYNISNVPINLINAYKPFGRVNLIENQIISKIGKDYIEFNLPILFSLKHSENINFGGSNLMIGQLGNISPESDYVFDFNLNHQYNNIAYIEMISSEIK